MTYCTMLWPSLILFPSWKCFEANANRLGYSCQVHNLNYAWKVIFFQGFENVGGEPVAVMHGANAPLLQRMIEKEIRKERQVLKGEAVRDPIMLEDAVPGKF